MTIQVFTKFTISLHFSIVIVLQLYCYSIVILGRVPSLVIEGKSQNGAQENGSKYIFNRFLLLTLSSEIV